MYSFINDSFGKGFGVGLFIQVSIILSLDFFAERRGHLFLHYLKEFVDKI